MNRFILLFFFFCCNLISYAQKDSLQLGDRYAEDQLYISISYAQLNNQPSGVSKSNFSYGLSGGFIKDFTINKKGSLSIAAGIGLDYNLFNHQLRVDEVNGETFFSNDRLITENIFKSFNLELPLEFRWRTSNAQKYSFWRIYTGIKFIYNLNNSFDFLDSRTNTNFSYSNVNAFNNLQYGLTLSTGYDAFNISLFYGLSPIFKNGKLNGETINTSILKFGLIFYFL